MYVYIIHTFSRCIFTMLTLNHWCMLKCSHFPWLVHWSLETFGLFVLQMRCWLRWMPKKFQTKFGDAELTMAEENEVHRYVLDIHPACLGLGWGVRGPSCSVKNGTKIKICVFGSKTPLQLDLKYSQGKWTRECSVRLLRGSNRMIHREVSILSYHHTFIWYHHRPPNTLK